MRTLVEMTFGSHLYGTANPYSDQDWKAVHLPNPIDILRCQVPKSYLYGSKKNSTERNGPNDVDRESYALHYFLQLLMDGETVALDMLHAPPSAWVTVSPEWMYLNNHRREFHTKNLKAFLGYAKRQAAKYGVKGSRLAAAKDVLRILETRVDYSQRVRDLVGILPVNEHCRWREDGCYEVCGKAMDANSFACHYIPMLTGFINMYGERAKAAEQNKGVDWKAVSRALRAAYQVWHILENGDFTYPLPETGYLIKVKEGKLDFVTEVSPELEQLIATIEELAAKSGLPATVPNAAWWFHWAAGLYQMEIVHSPMGPDLPSALSFD